jgi:hypothetical protein
MSIRIKLQNVDENDTYTMKGAQISVILRDAGQANVSIHLRLSSGDHFFFPDLTGASPKSTILPIGVYTCIVRIDASSEGNFGATYDSEVLINDQIVASAKGKITGADGFDAGKAVFFLNVT